MSKRHGKRNVAGATSPNGYVIFDNGERLTADDVIDLLSRLASLQAEVERLRQRVQFEAAWRIADTQPDGPSLAAYMLRDLPITKNADLFDLCHSMHKEGASKGDWDGLRKWWDEAYRKALPSKEGER